MGTGEPSADSGPERFEPHIAAGLPPGFGQRRLPVGRHGLTRTQVYSNQRARLIASMLRVLPRRGYAAMTIGDLVDGAGVSRAAFYDQFSDKEECFLATCELASGWLRERVEEATAVQTDWPGRVRARVVETLRLLAANPELARLFAVDAPQAGTVARRRQQACLNGIAGSLREGRPGDRELPDEFEEMLLGGALTTIARYVETGRAVELEEATPDLLEYLLIPYLGSEEARRIAHTA